MGSYLIKEYITEIIQIGVSLGIGILLGVFALYAFNHIPLKWVGEEDDDDDDNLQYNEIQQKRIKEVPWLFILGGFFILVTFRLITVYLGPYTLLDYFQMLLHIGAIWVLVQIGLSGIKYRAIPNVYILVVAVIGLFLEHSVIGAALGGGSLLILSLVVRAVMKKDIMDYQGVMLLAAVGFAVGTGYMAIILSGTALTVILLYTLAILLKKINKDDEIPLVPFIIFFTVVVMLS